MSKIAFLGTGSMASSLIRGLIAKGQINPSDLIATHNKEKALINLRNEFKTIKVFESNIEAVKLAEIIFLCVRPQQIQTLLDEIQPYCDDDKIIVSIAAGIRLSTIQKYLPHVSKIFHLHPSSLIFQSEKKFCVSLLTNIPQCQKEMLLIIDLLAPITEVKVLEESDINKFIVMVGCVPGYLALVFKYLFEVAEEMGIEQKLAFELEKMSIMGVQSSIFEKAYSPDQIIELIATSGGVTIAGIKALERNSLKDVLQAATNASLHRLEELSQDE